MRSDWEHFARGADAADAILRSVYGVDVRKGLNPLKLADFHFIVRSLAKSLKGQVVPVEDAALKQALSKLDAKWTDMDAAARAKLIGAAAHYLGPPVVAKVLPKIDQTLSFAAKDIVPATKKNAVLTYDLKIHPDLSATDERIANYVRVSQGHFITNKYGERMNAFAGQARDIVASGLEKGLGSAAIADDLHAALSTHSERGLSYWNTIAMVYANRARTMTQLASYQEAGIEAYVFESVLDEVTSVVCRFMHGRRFPVARAMQRFQEVENADSPEAIKTLQPFLSLGRDGDKQAIVFGRGDDQQVCAHVTSNALGQKDETGSYANALDDAALSAAGVTTPPLHGNCRSTIIPEYGSSSGGGTRGRPVPPPPLPPPERLTSGQRKAQAIEHLDALPTATDGHADASSLFPFHDNPPFLEHPMFADPDAGGALGAQWQVNATSKRPQLSDLTITKPTVDRGIVDKLLQKPKALTDAPVPKIVQYEGKLYVIDGHEQLVAQRLLGQKTANCDFVNLDKRLKVPPLVHPIEPGPPPPPPTLVNPIVHPPPPPPKKGIVAPLPPEPRLFMVKPPPAPDPVEMQKKIADGARKDAALLARATEDDQARLELAARKKLKKPANIKDKELIAVPFEKNDYDPSGSALYRIGVTSRKETEAAAVTQRVLIDDYVTPSNTCYRTSAERAIRELVDNGGRFRMPDESDPYRDGPPILIRVGNKLYADLAGRADPQLAAAKALGFKTIEARVIDANPALAELAAKENVEVIARQSERDLAHAAEAERIQRVADARAQREAEGSPAVVAAREKHQPADYAGKLQEQFHEAAASLGWGHAMQERGLDFPAEHLHQLAGQFENIKDHPLQGMAAFLRREVPKGQTVRGYLAAHEKNKAKLDIFELGRADANARAAKAASTILAHVDGIQAHSDYKIGTFSPKVGKRARVVSQHKWLAGLTDQTVSTPEVINVEFAKDGRASCNPYFMLARKSRHAVMEYKKDEETKTVFHELGHAIEGADRSRGLRASAFLDARTAGESARQLSEITGNSNYRPSEMARPDKFASAYVGKDYGRETAIVNKWDDAYFGPKAPQKGAPDTANPHKCTEVTAMAIQRLGERWQAALDTDPDHFLFGLGQLGGY